MICPRIFFLAAGDRCGIASPRLMTHHPPPPDGIQDSTQGERPQPHLFQRFPSLDAARMYGLEHSGTPNSPEEADGFRVIENGSIRSEFILKYRSG